MDKVSITAIILTKNEEMHIERCIKNLQQICQKIYVVDSFSTDSTCPIAEQYGAVVVQHEYVHQAQQFQWALDNLTIDTEWVIRMDADEYLTDGLIKEIKEKLPTLPETVNAANFTLRVKFAAHKLRFGMLRPVKILRLWRTGTVFMEQRWMDERLVLTQGTTVTFKHHFIDENLNGLTVWTAKHNQYSNREIVVQLDKKYHLFQRRESDTFKKRGQKKSSYYRMPPFFRAAAYFLLRYVFFLGFLDGKAGMVWHTLQAYWYRFLVDSKLYEMEKRLGKNPTREQVVQYVEHYFGIKIDNK